MKELTLRKMCEACGVSRRAVQGYEKYGLVSPCGKTERGYLLYSNDALEKVKFIKKLQNYGFSVSDAKTYFESEPTKQKLMLSEKLAAIKNHQNSICLYIAEIENLINSL